MKHHRFNEQAKQKKEMGTNPSNAHETKASATYDLKKKKWKKKRA